MPAPFSYLKRADAAVWLGLGRAVHKASGKALVTKNSFWKPLLGGWGWGIAACSLLLLQAFCDSTKSR